MSADTAGAGTAPADMLGDDRRFAVYDAPAYRRLAAAAGDEVDQARVGAVAAAADDAARGLTPAASPMTLWALLSELGTPAGGAAKDAAALARPLAALAACAAHVAAGRSAGASGADAPATGGWRLAPNPEATLCLAVAGELPREQAAWNAYLASLAAEVAAAPAAATVARLAGPLAHVRERAAQLFADFDDEIQDAVVHAYDAVADAGAWDDDASPGDRQAQVASGDAVLERVVAEGRAARAFALLDQRTGADLEAGGAAVRARFAPGVRVWRELVRAVVTGAAVPGGRGWRATTWALQEAFAAGVAPVALVRTGSAAVRAAARRAGVGAVEGEGGEI